MIRVEGAGQCDGITGIRREAKSNSPPIGGQLRRAVPNRPKLELLQGFTYVRVVLDAVVLRRTTRVLQALLIVAAAYGGALAINSALSMWLGDPVPVRVASGRGTPKKATASVIDPKRISYAPVFERNLFGSEPLEDSSGASPVVGASHGDLLLKGTAQINGRGFAVFSDRNTGKQDVFAIGERVFDGPKLVGVQESKAILLSNGRRITLEIAQEEAAGKEKVRNASGTVIPTDGIKKTGEGTYLVDRKEIDHSIENLSSVITKMRATPYMKDGESLGFRVFNIRPNSIFERMGLKNGDVIQNVNGNELRDPAKALSLLDTVGSASSIKIDLLRNAQPKTLSYAIR
jgi:general secretion pathway protein C